MNLFKVLFIGIIINLSFSFSEATIVKKSKFISIENHLKSGNITLKINSKGKYSGESIKMQIKNIKPDTLYILAEPGRRLISYDSTFQDILILKKYEIVLPPLAYTEISVYGFCCQSSNAAPKLNSKFNIGFMAPKPWIKLAEFVDKNNFPDYAVQNAVWVLSDNHPISSIHNEKPDIVYPLKKLVAELTNQELPWYSLTFKQDTSVLFTGIPEKIYGQFSYTLKHNTVISINIRNSDGTVITNLIDRIAKGPGTYTYYLKLPVINWQKGDYSVYVIENYSNVNTVKKFKL